MSYGDPLSELAVVAVRFKAWHAQWDAPAHNGGVAGNCAPGKQLTGVDSARRCHRLDQT